MRLLHLVKHADSDGVPYTFCGYWVDDKMGAIVATTEDPAKATCEVCMGAVAVSTVQALELLDGLGDL